MCGIAGYAGGEQPEENLSRAIDRLHHRGPDASAVRRFAGSAFGHTRLRVIDISPDADQPMPNEDQTIWTIFNGEIYNYRELRESLLSRGHIFRSHTDTEVLVHLYEDLGEGLVDQLQGMFAFAIWDVRADRLLLARDRLGIKPLYYRTGASHIEFASEVRALARSDDQISSEALQAFLGLGWVPGPGTILSGIQELPAATVLVWERSRAQIRRYWMPPVADIEGPSPSVGAPEEGCLRDALQTAIDRHLVADVPLGLFLSSGVDSAVVGSLARQHSPNVQSFTVAFDDYSSEAPEAERLAGEIGLRHVVIPVSGEEIERSLDRIIMDMDQPSVDGVNTWVISQAVRERGIVVALSGLGGDELFNGYSTFRHVPRLVRLGQAVRAAPDWARAAPAWAAGLLPVTAHSRSRRALEAVAEGSWSCAYRSVRGLFGPGELKQLRPTAERMASERVHLPWPGSADGPARVGQLELANYLPYQLLRDSDSMSMAHGLELRVPLLDDGVVAAAVAGQQSRAPWSKAQLVAAADPRLAYLVGRPKSTFTLPFNRWMQGSLRSRVRSALGHLGGRGLGFDERALQRLWDGFEAGHVAWRPVWALAVLSWWTEQHGLILAAGAHDA